MTDLYEWHQVEREDLNEGWIWVRPAESDENRKLMRRIEGRRPVLLLKAATRSVCCETLYADDTFLRNRRNSILIGEITDYVSPADFKVRDRNGKDTPIDASNAKIDRDTRAQLADGRRVCVHWTREHWSPATSGTAKVSRVTLENNLVFLSAWYRRRLGIETKAGSKISLKITETDWRLRTMWWQLRACARHPQIAVVMSTVLAVVGTGLGIVGLAAVFKEVRWLGCVWQGVAVLGFAVFVLGFWPLALRAKN